MQTNKDTVILDITDSADLQELFSRLEAGDEVKFKGKGSLQDSTEGVVVLTIVEISVSSPTAKKTAEKDNEDDEPVSVKAAKGQMDDEEAEGESPAQPMPETAGPMAGPTQPIAPQMQ